MTNKSYKKILTKLNKILKVPTRLFQPCQEKMRNQSWEILQR